MRQRPGVEQSPPLPKKVLVEGLGGGRLLWDETGQPSKLPPAQPNGVTVAPLRAAAKSGWSRRARSTAVD
jgi:hypothetical protein